MHYFANFGNRDRCAIPITCETWVASDFNWPETELSTWNDPAYPETWPMRGFANLEMVADTRSHVAGNGTLGRENDFAYSENAVDARFR